MIKVGKKVFVHRRNNPVDLLYKLWDDIDDIAEIPLNDLWQSIYDIYEKEGVVMAREDKNNVFVSYDKYGMWCLEEEMLEVIQ